MSGRDSLPASYFEAIFAGDADPWSLASSPYEAAKFAHTREVLSDRRYRQAVEIGCAHGVLTGTLLGVCDALLAVDISNAALALARDRLGEPPGLRFERLAFPRETPAIRNADLVVLSEVAYYWSDADLARASAWLAETVTRGGRVILVHYTGETDYPQTGDGAVGKLWNGLGDRFEQVRTEDLPRYRLDLWERR